MQSLPGWSIHNIRVFYPINIFLYKQCILQPLGSFVANREIHSFIGHYPNRPGQDGQEHNRQTVS
jgi:hypothetical protein